MGWKEITAKEEIDSIIETSHESAKLIFKHSPTCTISQITLEKLKAYFNDSDPFLTVYLLDVVKNKELSTIVSKDLSVYHESPQVLLIIDGDCIFEESHMEIDPEEIMEYLQ